MYDDNNDSNASIQKDAKSTPTQHHVILFAHQEMVMIYYELV